MANANFRPEDLSFDDQGRVIIDNPEVAKAMREYLDNPEVADAEPLGNGACMNNGCVNPQ